MRNEILNILFDFRSSWKGYRGRPFIDELCYRIEANLLMLANEPSDPALRRRTFRCIADLERVMGDAKQFLAVSDAGHHQPLESA